MLTKAALNRLRDLRDKKARSAAGRFVVENPKVVNELLLIGLTGHPFTELYATAEWLHTHRAALVGPCQRGLQPQAVTADELARISHLPTPSPVFAVGVLPPPSPTPPALGQGFSLALDGIQDPGNVGTLLRIADWFGFARVLLSPDCADLYSAKVIDASMGSFARVPTHTGVLAPWLAQAGAPVLGCDLDGTPLHELPALPAAVVVIGSEGRGLRPEVRACLTQRVTIPRHGGAESLNAAVAAGIVCAHLRLPASTQPRAR